MSSEMPSNFIQTTNMTTTQSMVASVGSALGSAGSALAGGISGLGDAVSGAVGGAIGQATGALNGLAGGLLAGGASIGGMLSQATGALDKLVSGAEESFFANSPARIAADKLSALRSGKEGTKSPAVVVQTARDATSGKPGLSFPSDIESVPYFFRMQFMKYKRPSPLGETTTETAITITLPLPGDLHEGFQMTYNDIELGAVGGVVDELQRDTKGATSGQAFMSNLASRFNSPGEIGASVASNMYTFGMEAGQSLAPGLTGTLSQFAGAVPNPHPSVVFQGMTLRSHSFSWILVPRDENESATIKNIINELRKKTLPSFESSGVTNILDYPYMIKPSIVMNNASDSLYKFKLCVCESFTVNYSPKGPAFYGSDDSPVAVVLTMTLKEIEYFTASDYGEYGNRAMDALNAANEFGKNTLGGGGSVVNEGARQNTAPTPPPGPPSGDQTVAPLPPAPPQPAVGPPTAEQFIAQDNANFPAEFARRQARLDAITNGLNGR